MKKSLKVLTLLSALSLLGACESKPAGEAAADAAAAAPKPAADAAASGPAADAEAGAQSATTGGGKKIVIKKDPSKATAEGDKAPANAAPQEVKLASGQKLVIKLKTTPPEPFKNPEDTKVGTLPEGVGQPVGTTIEPFGELTNTKGEAVGWEDITGKAPVLVAFYRGGWCRYCNFQVRRFSQNYSKFEEIGVNVVFISVDDIEGVNAMEQAYDVPFPLLSDSDLEAHKAFNVIFDVDAKELQRLESIQIDLDAWSKRTHKKIAIPSLFLIDKEGSVLWAHSERDFRLRPKLEQIVPALHAALKAKGE